MSVPLKRKESSFSHLDLGKFSGRCTLGRILALAALDVNQFKLVAPAGLLAFTGESLLLFNAGLEIRFHQAALCL